MDGGVSVKGSPGRHSVTLADVARAATAAGESLVATGSYATPQANLRSHLRQRLAVPRLPDPHVPRPSRRGEVDPVTGKVSVLRYVVAQEVGKAINPAGIAGQIQGGVAQGIGYALYENLQIGADGRYRQRTLETYRLPLAPDVPRVEVVLLEHPDPAGPFGAKGVAEPPVVPVAAAIANAVADAVGAPIDAIPISPEDVLDALDRAAGT